MVMSRSSYDEMRRREKPPEEELKHVDESAKNSPLMMMSTKVIAIIVCYMRGSVYIIWRKQDICTKFGTLGHFWTKAEIRNSTYIF
jgi:hypothetical protein